MLNFFYINLMQMPGLALALITSTILIKTLRPESYLIFSQITIMMGYILLLELNLPRILHRHVRQNDELPSEYARDAMKVGGFVGFLGAVIINLFIKNANFMLASLIGLSLTLTVLMNFVLLNLEVLRKHKLTAAIRQSQNLLSSASILISLLSKYNEIEELISTIFLIRCCGQLVFLSLILKIFKINAKFHKTIGASSLLKSQTLTTRNILDMTMLSMDKVLIGYFIPISAILTVNAPSYDLSMKVLLLIVPLTNIFFVNAIENNENNYNINTIMVTCSIVFMVSVPFLNLINKYYLGLTAVHLNLIYIYLIGVLWSIPNSYLLANIYAAKAERTAVKYTIFYLPIYYLILVVLLSYGSVYAFAISFTLKVLIELIYFKLVSRSASISVLSQLTMAVSSMFFFISLQHS